MNAAEDSDNEAKESGLEGRRCVLCGRPLSRYNPHDRCFHHLHNPEPWEEAQQQRRAQRSSERAVASASSPRRQGKAKQERSSPKSLQEHPVDQESAIIASRVLGVVAAYLGVSVEDVLSRSRHSTLVRGRSLVTYLLREDFKRPHSVIAGCLKRTTPFVKQTCEWMERYLASPPQPRFLKSAWNPDYVEDIRMVRSRYGPLPKGAGRDIS